MPLGSRKGGIGKSTLAHGSAVAAAVRGRQVLPADFDTDQLTCLARQARRVTRESESEIEVATYKKLNRLEKAEGRYDRVVADKAGSMDKRLAELAGWADAMLLPRGFSDDDLLPTLALAGWLKGMSIPLRKPAGVFARGGRSERREE